MNTFVGIDLGTTNSAICSYNGTETRIWKSPEQNDVTPSVILIERRGNKYVGKRAYDSVPGSPDNAAMLFKPLMGTSTPIHLPAVGLSKSPEECSAEVLKVLFGYLPEEIRNDNNTGTVVTVPAAFNQMQKDATLQATRLAGIGKVALMQEPVAAIMSVMRVRNADGIFLIYDLGGGTLDVAIAESISGHVNLLAHGGIARCGGRDFDRDLFDNIVRPWLFDTFALPEDFSANPNFKSLNYHAIWATERAKIELSAREEACVSLSETEARIRDLNGKEIYLDIQLTREMYTNLIAKRIDDSIETARETLLKVGLTSRDLERIIFIGGPTNYKPLRDKVSFELGIPGSTEVDPMTAVAVGASLFAESIDWDTENHSRKTSRGQISSGSGISLTLSFIARTPDVKSRIAVNLSGQVVPGAEFQIESMDTGWTSGRLPLKHGATVEVTLAKIGENTFKAFVFDSVGGPIHLEQDKIVITRTAATVDAIPASHSIGVEVLEKLGGHPVLDYLVRTGDPLPKKGKKSFKAAESLKAGSPGSINLKLWEGDIQNPIADNRPIGVMKIGGSDFDNGVISAGADLICEFEVLDSGTINLEVSVPSIGGVFHPGKNFYSRQESQPDFSTHSFVIEEGENTLGRVDEINEVIDSPKLDRARQKLESAISLDQLEADPERTQEAMENVYAARRLLAQVREENLKEIRQIELDKAISFFNKHVREYARPSEVIAFENLGKTAQRSVGVTTNRDFEYYLDELRDKNFEILWRQDWFVVARFKWMVDSPHLFADKTRFEELTKMGGEFMRSDEIEKLRSVVAQLHMIKIGLSSENEMYDVANIVKG